MKNKKALLQHRVYLVLKVVIFVGMSLFLVWNADTQSFWSDEMSTIGYIRTGTSIIEMLKGYMVEDAVNLPLYPLLLYFLYRIVPYGELYLLLPSIILCVAAIFIISRIGFRWFGEEVSLACVCVGALSIRLIDRGAWDIRCYALLVFLSALTLYFYSIRLQKECYRTILLYGISMVFLFYTHWFGALQMIFIALCDLILFLQKKVRFRCILSYLLAGSTLLPWLITMLFTTTRDLGGNNAASDVPDLGRLKETLYYLTGERYVCFLLLVIGIVLIGGKHFWEKRQNKQNIDFSWIVVLSFLGLVVGVYCYCRCLNPRGTFYENKYFMVSLPQVFLIMALSINIIIKMVLMAVEKIVPKGKHLVKNLVCIVLVVYYGKLVWQNYTICYNMAQDIRMPYRQCAEYLADEGKIYQEDVLVVSTETTNLTEAWIDYYFVKHGAKQPQNIVALYANRDNSYMETWDSIESEKIKETYKKIIVFSISFPQSEALQTYLDENYELVVETYNGTLSEYERK